MYKYDCFKCSLGFLIKQVKKICIGTQFINHACTVNLNQILVNIK